MPQNLAHEKSIPSQAITYYFPASEMWSLRPSALSGMFSFSPLALFPRLSTSNFEDNTKRKQSFPHH
jgi:hypothetical protein